MEAVKSSCSKRPPKKSQDPQDPRVERMRQPQAASKCSVGCYFHGSFGGAAQPAPEIVVIPQTKQMGPMEDIDTVENSG